MKDDYRPVKGMYTDGEFVVIVHGWETGTYNSASVGAAEDERVFAFTGALPYDPATYHMAAGEFLSRYPHRIDGVRVDDDEEKLPRVRKKVNKSRRRRRTKRRRERIGRLVQAVEKGGGSVRIRFEVNGEVWDMRGVTPGDGNPRIEYEGNTVVLSMNAETIEESVRPRKEGS